MVAQHRARTCLAGLIGAVAIVLAACSPGPDTPADTPSTEVRMGAAYETTNYDPSSTSSALALGTNWHVVEGLYELRMDTYEPYPALAAGSPEWSSETAFTVTLRQGASFSDGTPVTAEDVVSSFERAMADGNVYQPMLSFIETVEAADENTVSFTLTGPFTIAEQRLAVAKIVPESATREEMTAMPVGTGPYKYEEIGDTRVTAVPNEHYTGAYPAQAERLVWDVIKDDTARTTAANSGTIDVMEAVPADSVDMVTEAGMETAEVNGFNLPFMLFNTKKAPFDDPRVRQAFLYAVNTSMLVDNNMDGKAEPATSFLPETHPNYNRAANVFDHDPDRARQLLDEAGVADLNVTLLTTDHPWVKDLGPQIQNDLQAIGVDVSLQTEASASVYANHLDVQDATFDVAIAPGDPSVFGNDPALLMTWWYGDNVWTQKRTFWQESDPASFQRLQDILTTATELEGAEQQEKWNEALDLLSEEVPLYPLFHRTMITAYDPSAVEGFRPIGTTGLWALTTAPTSN
ncbi:ABC transporter substrate-binding protein [Corynebacterium auris]|uniref:ABC transporter substrate-binding protein n=1 Tax=Corynebacterium auris TaxID=44750 RepID=UPI0025B2A95D|nr:ABC transporter substrate-binding protein [Corynebacterium auris]WJY68232.1 putative D,D-dipeptide-binding periplasmic protein DdpA precursor [Corynebacterium auris]